MTRPAKIAAIAGGSLAALLLVAVVAILIVVQTGWFRDFVRRKIVAVTEEATGGRVELASLELQWRAGAAANGFVIHGKEPPGAAPLFQARRVEVGFQLLPDFRTAIDLRSLVIDQPKANIIVFEDGTTNIPGPKEKTKSGRSPLEPVVDLAIKRFELRNGEITFASKSTPLDARGENLTAQLFYDAATPAYKGRIGIDPLIANYARNRPLRATVTAPVVLERDRVRVTDAKITTEESQLAIDADVTHLVEPVTSARVAGRVSVREAAAVGGLKVSPETGRRLPNDLGIDAAVKLDGRTILVPAAKLSLGRSTFDASGTLKDASGRGDFRFDSALALDELGRIFQVEQQPRGTLRIAGNAQLPGGSEFNVNATARGQDISLVSGGRRIGGIGLDSRIAADPRRLELSDLNISGFGGRFAGSAGLEDWRYYHAEGDLRHVEIAAAARAFGQRLDYSGSVSGPLFAQGDLKAPGTSSIRAGAQLSIASSQRGVPLTGRLNVEYRGDRGGLQVRDSHLAFPNSKLQVSGAPGGALAVHLRTTSLEDFRPLLAMLSKNPPAKLPMRLRNGVATFDGLIRQPLDNPAISGRLALTSFEVEGRAFDRFSADLAASRSAASVQNAVLARGTMRADASASAGLHDWSPAPSDPVRVDATIRQADLADLLALAGQKDVPASGTLTAQAVVTGTAGNPRGGATLNAVSGTLYGEPFDRIDARVEMTGRLVTVSSARIAAGQGNVEANAVFEHPPDSFSTGRLRAHVAGTGILLERLRTLQKQRPGLAGSVRLNAGATAELVKSKAGSELRLTSVDGDFGVRGLRDRARSYGDAAAVVKTAGSTADYRVQSDFSGSNIQVTGRTTLAPGYPTTASANVSGLAIEPLLQLAGRTDLPVKGTVSGAANLSGYLSDFSGSGELRLANGAAYGQPLDRVEVSGAWNSRNIELRRFEAVSGPSRIALSASYSHAPGDLENGQLVFAMPDSDLHLARIDAAQRFRPGIAGTVRLSADGAATVRKGAAGPEVLFSKLAAQLAASGLAVSGKPLGDLKLAASSGGRDVAFDLTSNLGGSSIRGEGTALLQADYPVKGQVTFTNLRYSGLAPLLGASPGGPRTFDVLAEGRIRVDGPARRPEQMNGEAHIGRLRFTASAAGPNAPPPVVIENPEPMVLALDRGVVRIQSARLTGPATDMRVAGTADLRGGAGMKAMVSADTDLKILHDFDPNVYSAGAVMLRAAISGTMSSPLVNGRLELRNASFNIIDVPNGLSNANGAIVFNGNTATIENLSGETGGGKVSLAGTARFSPSLGYSLKATARRIRVRYPEGASILASSSLDLEGTAARSLLSGTVTLHQIGFNPRRDFGSMLASSTPPPQVLRKPSGPLEGMRLDVRIVTGTTTAVETSLAQSLQADADLRLRGTAAQPGMTGRINITQGQLVFFGSEYTVDQGSIAFYNPVRIEPVLNIDLQTAAKGVDVTLNVSGPVDNMKLTYHSDPPLQFSELVSLLAAGKTPTTDPTLLANQPATPPQTFAQMGESALMSQAIANPVASRLERVFGVNKLKIDPTFTSGSELPQARLTLQQQVTRTLTFTYITNLTEANSQIIRVEWAINPQWSAVATRDENGQFGVDFFLKKQFR